MPVEGTEASLFAFADRARQQGRRCSSLVGPADEIGELWRHLQHAWGPARDLRMRQPVMVIDGPPAVAPDPLVSAVSEDEIDIVQRFDLGGIPLNPLQTDTSSIH